jgi:hypothetical protein
MQKNDVIEVSANVSEVIHGSKPVARVFRGAAGQFYWIDLQSDAMPVGPFDQRENAEIDADVALDDKHKRDMIMLMIDG